MRAFIILCCLATAYAASLGYNYEQTSAPVSTGDYAGEEIAQAGPAVGGNDYSAPAIVDFEKEFYTFSAPEGAFDDNNANQQLSNSLKRGLRVIFIKNPENTGLENAALQLAQSAGQQQTAIYVLSKQADVGDLANKLNSLNRNANNKPEVHFVKYRTPADAENAQRTIQNEYESLGGKSSNHNGGVAPVLDFASKAPVSSYKAAAQPVSTYLPANKRV